MGRGNHLLRIALSANQFQLIDPPSDTEDDDDDPSLEPLPPGPTVKGKRKPDPATVAKHNHQTRLDAAQEAILSAIGFMTESGVKKEESVDKGGGWVSTFVGLVTYHLPLPMYSQRNQALVPEHPSLGFVFVWSVLTLWVGIPGIRSELFFVVST
jgi:hypothetical protein